MNDAPAEPTTAAPSPQVATARTIGWFVPRLQELARGIVGLRSLPQTRALEANIVSALGIAEAEFLKQQIAAASARAQVAEPPKT